MSRREVLRHVYASDLISSVRKPPGWLINGFWANQSQGMIAGEPKTFKSFLSMDMAISIASGTPFLGSHAVKQGTALIVQEENDDEIMKDRLVKIMHAKGMVPERKIKEVGTNTFNIKFPTELPLIFINRKGFLLDNEDHIKDVTDLIIHENVKLLILDPFYTMFDGNINDIQSVNSVLRTLTRLNTDLKVSIMLVHHNHKQNTNAKFALRAGQRMLGSMGMHAWTASALYLSRVEEERNTIKIEKEFRAFSDSDTVKVNFSDGQSGSFQYASSEVHSQAHLTFI